MEKFLSFSLPFFVSSINFRRAKMEPARSHADRDYCYILPRSKIEAKRRTCQNLIGTYIEVDRGEDGGEEWIEAYVEFDRSPLSLALPSRDVDEEQYLREE